MSDADAQDPPRKPHEGANETSRHLHELAEQLSFHAEKLEETAAAIGIEVEKMHKQAEDLHDRGDKASEGI